MASRTSTIVQAKKGALLHTNASNSAQLISINAISNTTTVNPKLSLLVHNANNATLNAPQNKYALTWTNRTIDIDIPNSGATVIQNTQYGESYIGASGSAFGTGSQWSSRFQTYDPWMLQKPTDYGNPSDSVCAFMHAYSNQANYISNVFDHKADFASFFQHNGNNTARSIALTMGYYTAGMVFDHYTNAFMGIDTNAYQTGGLFLPAGNTHASGNRTSDSAAYQALGGSYNYTSYSSSTTYTQPKLLADGGLMIFSSFIPPQNNRDCVVMYPFPRGEYGGTLPTDKSTPNSGSDLAANSSGSTRFTYQSAFTSYMYAPASSFQWMKYNPGNDRYYFCFATGYGPDDAGIWEVEWGAFTNSAVSDYGEDGNGPWNQNLNDHATHSNFSKWKKVADYPSGIDKMTIPARVGSSLWVSYNTDANYSGNEAWFSTDLKTWKTASDFISDGYVFQAGTKDGKTYFVDSSSGQVIEVVTGFADIAQDGLLEKETEIGNYTRNGLILNPGDSVYAENLDSAANISITITEVAI